MGGFVMDGQQHMGIRAPGKTLFMWWSLMFNSKSVPPTPTSTGKPASSSAVISSCLPCLACVYASKIPQRGCQDLSALKSSLFLSPLEPGFLKGLLALSVDFAHFLASSWIFISLLGPMSGMGMNMGMEGQWHYM
jgi:hypothetical protein